jgi:hypothetical protein
VTSGVHKDDLVASAQVPGPLFVLSVPRSGSSLLYTLLNQHSQIALLYEGDLPTMQLFLWGQFRAGGWRERWEFWNQGPSRNGITIESLPESVPDLWEATRLAYQTVARRKQAKIWGEKTPHWYESPLHLAQKFPDASFIFLWRDLRGVMGSIARAAVTERANGEHAFRKLLNSPERILLGNEDLKQACDVLKAQGRPVHEVDYEDLTASPSECMQQICRFLDVPFEEHMTSLEGADRSAVWGAGQHHALVRGDRIVGDRRPATDLSPRLSAKISRYVCRWKNGYSEWPKYPLQLPEGTSAPSFLELWRDRITVRSHQLWDKALILALHQIRPLFYSKKYDRRSPAVL